MGQCAVSSMMNFPKHLKELIAEFADDKIIPDDPKRMGELSHTKMVAIYNFLSAKGQMGMTQMIRTRSMRRLDQHF